MSARRDQTTPTPADFAGVGRKSIGSQSASSRHHEALNPPTPTTPNFSLPASPATVTRHSLAADRLNGWQGAERRSYAPSLDTRTSTTVDDELGRERSQVTLSSSTSQGETSEGPKVSFAHDHA
jgi:hypothetical protein